MNRPIRTLIAALALAGLTACSGGGPSPSPTSVTPTASLTPTATTVVPTPAGCRPLTVLTYDSFAVSDDVLHQFEQDKCVQVNVLKAGDAGSMVNQAILTKDNPVAEVLFGVDNTFLSRALDEGIFEPYRASALDSVPAALRLDARDRVTPIDYGDVCINYDKSAFTAGNAAPQTLAALTQPAYRSELVVEDPGTSSPGLAFMLATIVEFGESGDYTWLDFWRGLRANDVLVSAGWDDAYYSQFSGGAGTGDRPLVVSYATSPVAEVYYATPQPAESPTGVVTDGCFRQIEFAGILAGPNSSDYPARDFIEFMLSPDFQADIPLNLFVFPAVPGTQLPQVFTDNAAYVAQPLTMPPEQIAANREHWIGEWTDVVLH